MKNFTNMGATASLLAGIPIILGAPTTEFRFYHGLRWPSSISNVVYATGVGTDSGWKPSPEPSGGPQPYQQTHADRLLSRTKTNNGLIFFSAVGAQFDDATLSNPYTAFWNRFVSEPCEAQSLSGTVTCVIAQLGPTAGLTAITAAVIAISQNECIAIRMVFTSCSLGKRIV